MKYRGSEDDGGGGQKTKRLRTTIARLLYCLSLAHPASLRIVGPIIQSLSFLELKHE